MMLIIKNENEILQYDDSFEEKFKQKSIPYIKIKDGSELAHKILSAHEYNLVFDGDEVIDVNITKTIMQYKEDELNDPIKIKEKQKDEIKYQLELLDNNLSRSTEDLIDLLVSKSLIAESELKKELKDIKQQKKDLRNQLKNL